jgi:hypothetical protein
VKAGWWPSYGALSDIFVSSLISLFKKQQLESDWYGEGCRV